MQYKEYGFSMQCLTEKCTSNSAQGRFHWVIEHGLRAVVFDQQSETHGIGRLVCACTRAGVLSLGHHLYFVFHPDPTWPVSDFILIRSVIIAQASRGENSPRGAHWERRDALGPGGATSWPASFTNNLITQLYTATVPLSRGTRLGTLSTQSLLSAPALIKVSLLQARLVGKLILSNYTDVNAAFQRVIKIWPASFCFHSLMGKGETNWNWIKQIKY